MKYDESEVVLLNRRIGIELCRKHVTGGAFNDFD